MLKDRYNMFGIKRLISINGGGRHTYKHRLKYIKIFKLGVEAMNDTYRPWIQDSTREGGNGQSVIPIQLGLKISDTITGSV